MAVEQPSVHLAAVTVQAECPAGHRWRVGAPEFHHERLSWLNTLEQAMRERRDRAYAVPYPVVEILEQLDRFRPTK